MKLPKSWEEACQKRIEAVKRMQQHPVSWEEAKAQCQSVAECRSLRNSQKKSEEMEQNTNISSQDTSINKEEKKSTMTIGERIAGFRALPVEERVKQIREITELLEKKYGAKRVQTSETIITFVPKRHENIQEEYFEEKDQQSTDVQDKESFIYDEEELPF
jgi:tRNA 2-selenouridine synthase SelU